MEEKKINILVVDDEWNMRNLMKLYLTREGWSITEAQSGKEAIDQFYRQSFHLIILDIMMPEMDGWEVCSYIREQNSEVPILLLTARNETKDKVFGLNLGADDYLTKPFEIEELTARVKALLRRNQRPAQEENRVQIGEVTIFPDARQATIGNGVSIPFTPKEYDLLYTLAKNPNKAFAREELLKKVWGFDFEGDERTVDQHVKNIREKLKKSGCAFNPIKTVWGLGYQVQRDLQ